MAQDTDSSSQSFDFSPYVGRGFPGGIDADIAACPVAEPDLSQTKTMIRVCEQTIPYLYGGGYSPTAVRYEPGSRPALEPVVAVFSGSELERVRQAGRWTIEHVRHAHLVGRLVPDRGLTEEELIESGTGWCNEQTRVFITLCEMMGIVARVCFVFHANLRCGHTAAEVYLDGRWVFYDVTFDVMVTLPDGRLAEGHALMAGGREAAHEAYGQPLRDYFARSLPFVNDYPGWNERDRPTADRGGDLLAWLGVKNYLTKGVAAVDQTCRIAAQLP